MTPPLHHLLVVDDDKRLRNLLERYLTDHGYLVTAAEKAFEADETLKNEPFSLIILDVMMPGESGLDFLRRLRSDAHHPHQGIPVLLLTALDAPEDRIRGLEEGADDYLTKPFEPRELLLRLNNILSRGGSLSSLPGSPSSGTPSSWIEVGPFLFDPKSATLKRDDKVFYLTTTERRLLEIFISHPNQELSREDLADKLGMALSPRTIDVQITRLRRKLEEDTKQPLYLRTVRHKGYLFWPGA